MRIALGVALLAAVVSVRPTAPTSVCGDPVAGRSSAFAVMDRRNPSDSVVTLTVCIVSDSSRVRIAGYHGELTLSPNARVLRVDRPPGGTRIENAGMRGRVSFAGVAAEGIRSGPVLGLLIAQNHTPDDARVRLILADITDITGRDVASQVQVDSLPRQPRLP